MATQKQGKDFRDDPLFKKGIRVRKAVLDAAFLAKFVQPFAYDPVGDSPSEFAASLVRDAEANARRIRALGLKLEL